MQFGPVNLGRKKPMAIPKSPIPGTFCCEQKVLKITALKG
jgi:hypothetical protein